MDAEVKQRNRRRKRAQRMQAQRDQTKTAADSNEEDESPIRAKPPRPLGRRKKAVLNEPLVEEDFIDGFAILGFKTYDDLETVLKLAHKENVRRLVEIERPKHEPRPLITHHISAHPPAGITLTQCDPGTSDDSGRASERLTGSSMAPRDADSSRDRLSDASSRCSSGKGYICDSEGEDDKGSDASSVIFGGAPASRKHEFPGALPPSLPSLQHHGTSTSPVPAPTPPDDLPPPSPAPAQLQLPPPPPVPRLLQPPPPSPVQQPVQHMIIEEKRLPPEAMTVTPCSIPSPAPASAVIPPTPPPSAPPIPVTSLTAPPLPLAPAATLVTATCVPSTPMIQSTPAAAAALIHHPPPSLEPSTPGIAPLAGPTNHARTDSPAVATSAPGYHPPFHAPLYAPYAASGTVHAPYTAASAPQTSTPIPTTATTVTTTLSQPPTPISRTSSSPRGHSPTRERESYSSGVSSLSRNSATPLSCSAPQIAPPAASTPTTTVSSSLTGKPWTPNAPPQLSPAPRPTPPPPVHNAQPFAPPMFTAPMPPPSVARASPSVATPPTNPNPFAAENLYQSSNSQADMLRRELDNRFLASQDSRGMNVAPPPYLRTEMHQHQHHHTHVHQHTTSLLPPPPTNNLFPPPMQFKEIPKLGSHESPFYRQNIGLPANYPGYTPGLLHPGLTGPTPFVPPSHLPAFQPKPNTAEQSNKPKITKSGKWNAMHVRVAWEIYHHQHKGDKGGPGTLKGDLLRPPTHLFNPSVARNQHEMPSFPPVGHRPPPPTFEQQPHPGSLFTSPASHSLGISGSTISPFTRYGAPGPGAYGANPGASPFSVSPFPPSAAGRPNEMPQLLHDPWRRAYQPPMPPNMTPNPWSLKPDPMIEQREREERERQRREREERERREREEKQRRIEQQQQAEQRERERRDKERREMERREMEQRERERERILHQQRLAESKPLPSVIRDRSPGMRNGEMVVGDIRIKEEPRSKEEEQQHAASLMMRDTNQMMRDANAMMRDQGAMMRGAPDPRYHPYLRHHSMQPSPLSRVLPPPGGMHHYPGPPTGHWPPPPPADYYRYDALRYNPLVDAAMRAEEERAKLFGSYGHPHPSQLRAKDPGLMHLRPGPGPGPPQQQHKMCATPPTELHKKEEPR